MKQSIFFPGGGPYSGPPPVVFRHFAPGIDFTPGVG